MMNTETKRHIDSARQVLVGVVPNPTSQIDQITNALIYKFMDDMDQAAIKAGGEPSFFIDDLERYSWTSLMDSRMGNQERMNLYSEALSKFSQAKQLPELFRDIFKSAFLPYRSPDILGLFLKEVAYFDYSHPEELGNAYEYLLSIMSSQGDAGQFRTPRHIIDFIVNVINPTKDDKILDPACGTGGFLVSSYKHICKQHDSKDDNEQKKRSLNTDERKKLMNNLEGYDIDPMMVRIAQVNMYLHQFKNPKICNYDTLSSDERWNDKFDVILANPPFMSPKGGIKPHSRFSIQASRSEVLFVDYIMNHLRPRGRAGIIVPEGIIFRPDTVYKTLRKNLIENGLYAVVSLPSGVFQPYSPVKTSILFIDNELAKHNSEILFIKVDNDGFDLGEQRRAIDKNDLPRTLEFLNKWKVGEKVEDKLAVYIKKSRISESGDYNLSGDRYLMVTNYTNAKWPMIKLDEVCKLSAGNTAPQNTKLFENGKYPFFRTSDVGAVHLSNNLKTVNDWLNEDGIKGLRLFKKGTILFPKSGASTFLNHRVIMGCDGYVASHLATIYPNKSLANSEFIYYILTAIDAKQLTSDHNYPSLRISEIGEIKIPFPPLEIQEQIVAELNGYSEIIAGARKIVEHWKPKIDIDSEWPMVKLGDVCNFEYGKPLKQENRKAGTYPVFGSNGIIGYHDKYLVDGPFIVIGRKGSAGVVTFSKKAGFPIDTTFYVQLKDSIAIDLKYLYYAMNFLNLDKLNIQSGVPGLNRNDAYKISFPLPPLDIQKQIVDKIEAERELVESTKKLISIYEQKTKDTIAKLWSE